MNLQKEFNNLVYGGYIVTPLIEITSQINKDILSVWDPFRRKL